MMDLSPERSLLLACARATLTDENCQRILELASADLDWGQFVSISYAHGIAPLVYHSLHQYAVIDRVPSTAAKALRDSYYLNAVRNSLLYNELTRILSALGDQSIEIIVLKGAALAETVYRNRALRPMTDIDLLVKREPLADVETTLLHMGYGLDSNLKTYHQNHHYHWVFTKSAAPSIEIHWHVQCPTDRFRIDIEGCWRRAKSFNIVGVEALTLSPEDLLLHVCQHMHKHDLIGGIRPLCDVAHVVEYYRNTINWVEFRTRACQWGISPYVYLVLYLAKDLLDARIPSSFLDDFETPDFDQAVIPWATERLLQCEPSPISYNAVQLCWKGHRFRDRLAALGNALAPEVVAQSYGGVGDLTRILLYYPLRIKDLLTRYSPLIWQLLLGDQKTRIAMEREDKQLRLSRWLSDYQSGR